MPLVRLSCALPLRRSAPALALLLALGCGRTDAAPRADSAAAAATPAAAASFPERDRSGWNPAAGPALLIPGATTEEAVVLFPFAEDTIDQERLDSASVNGADALLLGRGGARLAAHLTALPDSAETTCERWLLRDVRAEGTATTWAVGFVDASVVSVPLDSVELLSARDSVALAAEATRLASTVTAPTGPSFQGLRFAAHDIRRFEAAPGVQAFVAHLVRRVNQEANPQEEQTLIIAERDSGTTTGRYHLVYAERSFGREEVVVTPEVLAAVRLGGSPQPTLVVARDGDAGVVYAFVERTGPKKWRARWTSAASGCS